jgi:diamine N-acetyltransferase
MRNPERGGQPAAAPRVGGPADAALLADLGARTFRVTYVDDLPADDLDAYVADTFAVSRVAAELADGTYRYLIAEVAGVAAGYALLHDTAAPAVVPGPRPLMLSRLYLEPRFQGAGIGTALMARCLTEAAALGHGALWLTVWERNVRALAFYDRWGFATVAGIPFEIGGVVHQDRIMARRLDRAADRAR